jgi:ankyrin repeat protein
MLGLYSHFAAEGSHRANRALLLAERLNAEVLLTAVTSEPNEDRAVHLISADDSRAMAATDAVQAGDLDALERMLTADPWLATARIGDWDRHRTLLHAATDWPGHFPNGSAVVQRLVAAGADVNAHSKFSSHTETPLHWAASSDDVDVLDALLDAGADIEASGAVLGGGTALADACGFGNWAAARRLVEQGARTRLNDAAALGLLDRVEALFAGGPTPDPDVITQSFWNACHGSQLHTAEYLLDHGADINWIGWDDKTPLDLVDETDQPELAAWLRAQGAKHAKELRR